MIALKLATVVAAAGVAAAAGLYRTQPPATTPKAPATAQPKAPGGARELTEQDCRDALERIRDMKRQIGGIERKLDESQKALNAAKGEARLDQAVKIINEMADDRRLIRQKQVVIDNLTQGHLLEHIRSAKSFEDLQHDLGRCVLTLYQERVAQGVEEDESTPAKK